MSSEGGEKAANEQYPDSAFLEAIRDGNQGTKAIADAVGCKRRTADYRLRQLEEAGDVTSEKIGRSLVWSIPDE
jgi:predicted transcriptional regulator